MNAIMKYPGAKWALAEWIIAHFPPHHSYLEPFFGSGAVLLSGYDSELYCTVLKDWHREERKTLAQNPTLWWEVLWMNFEPPAQEALF